MTKAPPKKEVHATFWSRLFAPVDIASLVYFRIAFGAIMLWETWRFIDHDWVGRYFSDKSFYFTYWPFDFVQPWPGEGMIIHMYVMGIVAICMILGLFYRLSAMLFFLMITYIFLLEKARYLNHLYLVCLIAFLMIFVPAHRNFSVDVLRKPELRSNTAPAWSIWLFRFQVGVPYFFGGIAKLNADWLRGEPLRAWLADRTDFPLLGNLFTYEPMVWLMTYGSLLLDLFVVFLLVNRRTRVLGFLGILIFHFMNSQLFGIGIFPWLMIAATGVFFEPDWPRRVVRDLKQSHPRRLPPLIGGFGVGFFIGALLPGSFSVARALIGATGVAIAAYHFDEPFRQPEVERVPKGLGPERFSPQQKCIVTFLCVWVTMQFLIPLRHFVIRGNVHWTEEGHNFSWHMKLRDKDSYGFFVLTDSVTGEEWKVDPRGYLTRRQVQKMTSRPHMIVQFAHYLKDRMRMSRHQDVEVRAVIFASLNGREFQVFIDPNVDLSKIPYPWFGHADWILPLDSGSREAKDTAHRNTR